MEPYRVAVRRSWMRGTGARPVYSREAASPLTQLRLGSKLPSLRSPLPHGRGIKGRLLWANSSPFRLRSLS